MSNALHLVVAFRGVGAYDRDFAGILTLHDDNVERLRTAAREFAASGLRGLAGFTIHDIDADLAISTLPTLVGAPELVEDVAFWDDLIRGVVTGRYDTPLFTRRPRVPLLDALDLGAADGGFSAASSELRFNGRTFFYYYEMNGDASGGVESVTFALSQIEEALRGQALLFEAPFERAA